MRYGFTIVEVSIIIAVIGILVAITTVLYTSTQGSARDAERESDTLVLSEALEKYYQQNGEYPLCSEISGPAREVVGNVLTDLPEQALISPTAPESSVTSVSCADIAAGTGEDVYAYVGDRSGWTLKYRNEAGEIVTVSSRPNAPAPGSVWTAQDAPAGLWGELAYGAGRFVVVGPGGANRIMSSTDGTTWTAHDSPEANDWSSVAYGNGRFVAVASGGHGPNRIMTSTDGVTWTARPAPVQGDWGSVAYGNGRFVAVARSTPAVPTL